MRHGQTRWSRQHRYTGTTDLALTSTGRMECEQARTIIGEMVGPEGGFDRVWASPLRRAVQSAKVIFGVRTVEITDLLRELDFGSLEGLTLAEAKQKFDGWQMWESGGPDGESIESLGERADRFLAEHATGSGRVAVVAHGYILRAIAVRFLGLPATNGAMLSMSTASVSLLADRRDRRVIQAWNMCPPALAAG